MAGVGIDVHKNETKSIFFSARLDYSTSRLRISRNRKIVLSFRDTTEIRFNLRTQFSDSQLG